MCGIAGFVDFTGKSSEAILQKQTATLLHRGPDGGSHFFVQNKLAQVGLGHRRLSIIDLSESGTQPMHYEGLHIVFNGEIYNYREIKTELENLGHRFHSSSDTEVILHSIKAWGYEAAVKKWHGMFAIAVYDEAKSELVCLRDRAGVKPFYYHFENGRFFFGSELKAIVAHPAFEKKVDRNAVASFLKFGYVSHPHCIWKNTFKLSQGHMLKLDFASGGLALEKYWDVFDCYKTPKQDLSFEEAVTSTEGVLKKAFDYRMVADVPVGVFLSGGFDSTCVAALLQEGRTERIRTFTIGSDDKTKNEAPFAKQIAQHLGTEHTEYYCTAKDALDIIPGLPYYYDEPFADSSAIPTMLVSRLARKDVTVSLSADAGDEVFAGYQRYEYMMQYHARLNAVPKFARRILAGTMKRVPAGSLPYFSHRPNFSSRYHKVNALLGEPSPNNVLKSLSQVFTDEELGDLFSSDIQTLVTAHDRTDLAGGKDDVLSHWMAVDYQTYMCDDILQKVDRATMAAGLEGREPFLDQDVIAWAAALPNEYKYKDGVKKRILKEIVYRHVPRELMDREKMGFSIPIRQWLRNELKPLVAEYLSSDALRRHGLFKEEGIQTMLRRFYAGQEQWYLKIWYLLTFQMWYRQWMEA